MIEDNSPHSRPKTKKQKNPNFISHVIASQMTGTFKDTQTGVPERNIKKIGIES